MMPMGENFWRYAIILILVAGSLIAVFSFDSIHQDPAYHAFADSRKWVGIPNFLDVISNIVFLIVGISGILFCLKSPQDSVRNAWLAIFSGIALITFGSAYYHLNPSNDSLVWDRLPMTIGFMGLFVALLAEYLNEKLANLLIPALLLGLGSVVYWHVTDDLRLYAWVQFIPLITIPTVVLLLRTTIPNQWLLVVALALYLLAKVVEFYDAAIFTASGELLSGHSLKHLLAAAAVWCILIMLQKRKNSFSA